MNEAYVPTLKDANDIIEHVDNPLTAPCKDAYEDSVVISKPVMTPKQYGMSLTKKHKKRK